MRGVRLCAPSWIPGRRIALGRLLGALPGALLTPGASEPSKLLLHDLVEIPLGLASLSEP